MIKNLSHAIEYRGKKLNYITETYFNGLLAGDRLFAKCCHDWLLWLLHEPVTLNKILGMDLIFLQKGAICD